MTGSNEEMPYIVGESARMREIHTIIQKAASWDANVCIEGENGTGKELVARSLHVAGPRRDRPYVTLDCSTIPQDLIDSHLFGEVRGAFTGGAFTGQGVLAQAHTGTLFITGIDRLGFRSQALLLRVIQTGEFTMVGGSQPQRVDVRIIAATNRDLWQAVFEGAFREDLFFRIVVIRIAIPPLRERREDIPLLVAHFLRGLSHGRHQGIPDLTERAMTALMNYSWPGNVRQVKNSIEQALVLADGKQIDLEHFPSLTRAMSETPGASEGGMPPPDVGQVDPLSGPPYPRPITRPSDAMLRAKAKEIAGFVRARGLSVEDALEVYNRVLDGLRQARGHPPASGTGSEGRAA